MNINTQTIYGEYIVNKNPLFFFAIKTASKVGGELNENNNVYLYYMGLC